MTSNSNVLGQKLRAYRNEQRLSLRAAAEKIDISYTRLSEIERGFARASERPTRPSREVVLRMAEVYKVPTDYLLELAGFAASRAREDGAERDERYVAELFRDLPSEHQELAVVLLEAMLDYTRVKRRSGDVQTSAKPELHYPSE